MWLRGREVVIGGDLRGKEGHVGAADDGVGDAGVEGGDGDEHDGVGEGGEDVRGDDGEQVPGLHAGGGEDHHGRLGDQRGEEAADEGVAPDVDGRVGGRPAAGVVAEADFEGEVDEDGEGHVFLAEALVEEFEVGGGVVGLEADFGDQVDDDDGLDVAQFQDAEHALVDFEDAVAVFGLVFLL